MMHQTLTTVTCVTYKGYGTGLGLCITACKVDGYANVHICVHEHHMMTSLGQDANQVAF